MAVTPELPPEPRSASHVRGRGRPGARGGPPDHHLLGAGLWGTRLFMGPASPFLLGLGAAAGFHRHDGVGELAGTAQLSLLLPLVGRFTIGVAPAGLQLTCGTHFDSCQTDVVATLGVLLVPIGSMAWLGIEGPRWSWTERTIGPAWIGLSLGWSHEVPPRFEPPSPEAIASWDPPSPDEVRSFRRTRSTRAVFLATTTASRPDNIFVGAGLDWRLDRDRWDRDVGLAQKGAEVEIDARRIENSDAGRAPA